MTKWFHRKGKEYEYEKNTKFDLPTFSKNYDYYKKMQLNESLINY